MDNSYRFVNVSLLYAKVLYFDNDEKTEDIRNKVLDILYDCKKSLREGFNLTGDDLPPEKC